MALDTSQYEQLQNFFNQSGFAENGAVITDLDGTAIHEYEGRYMIPQSVELGLKKIYDLGRPVVINTLRFPLSVMRTFGKEWYAISNVPVPTILMNGSQLGYMKKDGEDTFTYEELAAFPLKPDEINKIIEMVNGFLENALTDAIVFYYPRDWKQGEIIWTPLESRVEHLKEKYKSASRVIAGGIDLISKELKQQEICMVFMLIDLPKDKLMAYQHTKKNNFFTTSGVDKSSGTLHMAELLSFDLKNSLGAGDSEMDIFLQIVGQAVHVGNPFLKFEGVLPAIKLKGSSEFGDLLFELSAMQRTILH